MKLYIPALGELLTLKDDWEFELFAEDRNRSLIEIVEGFKPGWQDFWGTWDRATHSYIKPAWFHTYPKLFTIPKDSVLRVERIYIRKGSKEFDSLTFRVMESPDARLKKCRFWAKLDDVNMMDIR